MSTSPQLTIDNSLHTPEVASTSFENTPEYWLNTSELVREMPHIAGFAAQMWDTVEPTQENYRWFTKYVKTVALQQAEFLTTLNQTNPESRLIVELTSKYDLNMPMIARAYENQKRIDRQRDQAYISELTPVLQTANGVEIQNMAMFEWPKTVGDFMTLAHDKTVDMFEFLQNHKMAMLISAMIALGGLGADWVSSSYWSLENFVTQVKTPGFSLQEVNGLLLGTGFTLGEIFAATLIFKQGPKLFKEKKYWQALIAEGVGIGTALATIPSYFLTMNFIGDMFRGDPNSPISLMNIIKSPEFAGEKTGQAIIDYMWHFTTIFANYYSDLFIVLAQEVFDRKKKN